jgi:hypothetical protein
LDQQWLQARFKTLKDNVMVDYSGKVNPVESAKGIDYIALNFLIVHEAPFLTNFAILYIDQPGEWRFRVTFLKALDLDGIRYFQRQDIAESVSLRMLESNIWKYLDAALDLFESWNKDFVMAGEQGLLATDQ